MTLLIACLLIHNFDMAWWWYAVAAGLWSIKAYLVIQFGAGIISK